MRGAERGYLLLSSSLGDPGRKPLTTSQLRTLADRSWLLDVADLERGLTKADLATMGYGPAMAERILALLSQEDELDHYLRRGRRMDCVALTRMEPRYPMALRLRLVMDCPGVLWAKGDLDLLNMPKISLVGSRDLLPENRRFAQEVGRQAARQGYALVSGNARGADRTAQDACLAAGGAVISVVADELARQPLRRNTLFLSEDDFDAAFSGQRAIRRNRVIHALGEKTLVAQCGLGTGGTWDGTVKNLRGGWSPVFCFDDGSEAARQLRRLGACPVGLEDLANFDKL